MPMVIEQSTDAVAPNESVTVTVKENRPISEGMPETTPALLITRPVGKLPAEIEKMYGGSPEPARNVCE